MNNSISYAFFGTGPLAESVVASLVRAGYIPSLIITKPDTKQGRHMHLVEPYIKTWATIKNIPVYQPESLKDIREDSPLHNKKFDVFIVASYGKLIPDTILSLATHGALNVHPSLLPMYRGPSPIETALLHGDSTTGVTIIRLDNEMDHGDILAQNMFTLSAEETAGTLEVLSGQVGGDLLVNVLPHYLEGTLHPLPQDHSKATFCTKITKDMGLISLTDSIVEVRRKYRALTPWPGLYFFIQHDGKDLRVKINSIDLITEKESSSVSEYILSVTPEGKKHMDFESFKRGYTT
jgi:methionyl-tRNA formyltransferase